MASNYKKLKIASRKGCRKETYIFFVHTDYSAYVMTESYDYDNVDKHYGRHYDRGSLLQCGTANMRSVMPFTLPVGLHLQIIPTFTMLSFFHSQL